MPEAVVVLAKEYLDEDGNSPFDSWYRKLDPDAARIVHLAIAKRKNGITGHSRNVGAGVHEIKQDKYRIYYGIGDSKLIILLGGGTKQRQQTDIDSAKDRWRDYKRRMKAEQGG